MQHGKNIQIFLPNGNPQSVRLLDMEELGLLGLAEIPRLYLSDFYDLSQAKKSGLYFLNGKDDLYIGQTAQLGNRLKEHDKNKDFWQTAFTFFSLKENFETTELLYLEQLAINQAKETNNYFLKNNQLGNQSAYTSPKTQRKCHTIFDEIKWLLEIAKQDFFIPKPKEIIPEKTETLFYCVGKNTHAFGYLVGQEFLLKKGSFISQNVQETMMKRYPSYIKMRNEWLKQGKMAIYDSEKFILVEDVITPSASAASHIALGRRTSSGLKDWKTEDGILLANFTE